MSEAIALRNWKTDPEWFQRKIALICDPYFEREFFTNLIFCMDRDKNLRDIMEEALACFERGGEQNDDLDRAILHLFYAYQASSFLRESYQALPVFQALFAIATFRSDGSVPITHSETKRHTAQAASLKEFQAILRRESRRVSSFDQAWSQLLFFLGNRSMRTRALQILIQTALLEADVLTAALLMKAIDLSFANAWKNSDVIMKRAFERFWEKGIRKKRSNVVGQALSLTQSAPLDLPVTSSKEVSEETVERFWAIATTETPESLWSFIHSQSESLSFDRVFSILELVRGRSLFTMKLEQWPLVSKSVTYAAALRSAARWVPEQRALYLASSVIDVVRLVQLVSQDVPQSSPDAASSKSLSELSKNLSKNQLVLRLDDACEKGDRRHALELMKLIVSDRGLSHSVSDRLVLMACKQDAWTYDQMTIPLAMNLTQAYQDADRLKLLGSLSSDALYGLLRFLSDQRQKALQDKVDRGHYEDGGLKESTFDVSGGARILDRFVFNQLRNSQRIQVWPSEAKG